MGMQNFVSIQTLVAFFALFASVLSMASVLLHDGRTQTVAADGYSGYSAHVHYNGHASPAQISAHKPAPAPGYRGKRRVHSNKGTPGAVFFYQDKVYTKDDIVKFGARESRDAVIPWTNSLYSVLNDGHAATYSAYRHAPTSAHKPGPTLGYRGKRRAHSSKGTPGAVHSYQDEVYAEDDIVKFGARESRDAVIPWTNGQYSVLLPDGRTQTVTYTVAEDYSGYIADVKYTDLELLKDH